ncbi:hypothetical protein A2U01_0067796, partial [Trifolium medium]|nr:hypothetical protein [Trifolium medium]
APCLEPAPPHLNHPPEKTIGATDRQNAHGHGGACDRAIALSLSRRISDCCFVIKSTEGRTPHRRRWALDQAGVDAASMVK